MPRFSARDRSGVRADPAGLGAKAEAEEAMAVSKRPTRSHFGAGQKAAVEVLTLAAGFAAAVAVFWLVGRTIDNRVGSEPWGQVAGALVGWVLGFLHVYYGARRIKG